MIKRKGFTLIELLIVVVIIGVLSSMMSISSTSAVDSAKASAVLGNLATMKKAMIAVTIESNDASNAFGNGTVADLRNSLAAYMGIAPATIDFTTPASYDIAHITDDGWYVVSDISGASTAVKNIIKERANVIGLYEANASGTTVPSSFTAGFTVNDSNKCIALKVK